MSAGHKKTKSSKTVIHASCVAYGGRGLMIIGESGSGKSSLALSLMALGASLVSDDRVILEVDGDEIRASAPTTIAGVIEARGIGLLTCEPSPPVAVNVVVDMDKIETTRLPERRFVDLLGKSVPLLYRVTGEHFDAALLQLLKSGRVDC